MVPGPSVVPVVEPEVETPAVDRDGGHERMTHIVLEGFRPDDETWVPAGPSVAEGIVTGTPVKALCGKVWVPRHDPRRHPLCPTCREIAEQMGWRVPAG